MNNALITRTFVLGSALAALAVRSFRALIILAFGAIIPAVLVVQAYGAMKSMDSVVTTFHPTKLAEILPATDSKKEVSSHLDYTFSALLFVESSNRNVMLSKQRMKMSVMQVGFAVISIGFMLIFLGIDAGGIEGSLAAKEGAWSGSIKVASTGVVVFLIGAGMVTMGGVLRNEYATVGIPAYAEAGSPQYPGVKAADEPKRQTSTQAADADEKAKTAWMADMLRQCHERAQKGTQALPECIQEAAQLARQEVKK